MNKEKFLESLRKKLSILEESEIEDIISEYDGYIEEKIAQGSTEKEAVKSMGNVDELARELLSAYKIKNPEEKSHDTFNNLADEVLNIFERIIDIFTHKSFNDILRFVFELIFILLIIAICKLPFEIIENMGRGVFVSLGVGVYSIPIRIWNFILEFAYLIFAILLFIKIFENRYLNDFNRYSEEKVVEEPVENKKSKKEKSDEEKKNRNREIRERIHERRSGIIDNLADLCMLFVRIIAFFILVGVIFYVVGMATVFGISIYLIIKKVFYFGIYLILLSLFILGIIAFIFLFNFVFNRKSKVGLLLILTLVSFVTLGIGVGVSAIEFANTTIIYNEEAENKKVETYTFDMKDNLVLSPHIDNEWHVIIDEEMKDQIKVEYSYDDAYLKIQANPYIGSSGNFSVLHTGYRNISFTYSKEFFDHLIDNLKHKRIIASDFEGVTIKIYVSSETKEKLVSNSASYYHYYDYDYDYDDAMIDFNFSHHNYRYDEESMKEICEELYLKGYNVPNHCYHYIDYTEM